MTERLREAARRLAGPILTKGYKPTGLHCYTNACGRPLFWRIRAKHHETGDKWIRPMHINGNGFELGEPRFEGGKPLYALRRIVCNPAAVVWIVEGEQKADALNKLGPVATTSGGATSAAGTDFKPLRGRTVVIWPDNDEPGRAYAGEVARILLGLGCAISCIEVEKLELGESEDVIDWLRTHPEATGRDIEMLPVVRARPVQKNAPAGDPDSREWGDPIPFDEIDTPGIPARLLPDTLAQLAAALATATETPEALAVMMVLGVVSAAVAKRFCVSPVDGWREPMNIYALIALPPGNNKSTVFNACAVPLVEWERERAATLAPEIMRQKSERKSQEKIIEAKRGALAKENDAAQQKELMREIACLEAKLSEPQIVPQLFANDATPESLATNIHEQGGRFAIFSDEGGITETMSGLYTGGQANIDTLLKGIDGGHVRVRRKDRSFDLNPFLTVVLAVQPVIIQRMGEKKAFSGKGLLERFLWVLPKSNLGYRTHDKPPVPEAVTNAYRNTIRGLLDIPPLMEEGTERARVLTLEPGALSEWRAFQAAIELQLRPDGRLAVCQGWGGKISGFALRLAGLLNVAEHGQDRLTISADTMGRALELAALLTEHALAAYGLMGLDQATADAKDCWRWIRAQGRSSFTNGELSLAMRHRMHKERIDRALKVLHDRQLVSELERIPGKKTLLYWLHPQFVAGGE